MMNRGSGVNNLTKICILFIVIFQVSFANTNQEGLVTSLVTEDQILEKLQQIMKSDLKNFISEMDDLHRSSINFVKERNEACISHSILIEVNADGDRIVKKVKKTKKEKKRCLYKIVDFRKRFTVMAFKGRKQYLNHIQKKQRDSLVEFERTRVKALDKLIENYK